MELKLNGAASLTCMIFDMLPLLLCPHRSSQQYLREIYRNVHARGQVVFAFILHTEPGPIASTAPKDSVHASRNQLR